MLNIFQLASNDQSIYYLGQIFGNVGIALAGAGPAVLGNMFKAFNTALLSVGALIITYTTVVGTLKTAGEGKFLGEKWSSLWIPIRMVMGIVALMPTKAGYCLIQVIFMWLIVQGVGAADMVWERAANYFASGGVASTPAINYNTIAAGSDPTNRKSMLVTSIFTSLVCQAADVKYRQKDPDVVAHSTFVDDGSGTHSYLFGVKGDPNYNSECGMVQVGVDQTHPGRADAQVQALQTLVPVLEILANYYVNQMISSASCWDICTPQQVIDAKQGTGNECGYFNKYTGLSSNALSNGTTCLIGGAINANGEPNKDPGWTAVKDYSGSNFMVDAATMFAGYAFNYAANANMNNQNNNNAAPSPVIAAINQGWINSGAYLYQVISKPNAVSDNFSDFITSITAQNLKGPDPNATFDGNGKNGFVVNAYNAGSLTAISATNDMLANNQGKIRIVVDASNTPISGASKTAANLVSQWIGILTPAQNSNTNPLMVLQGFGHSLLLAAQILFLLFLVVAVALGVVSINYTVVGTSANPAAGIGYGSLAYILPPVFFIIVVLAVLGATFGVYLPLVPYLIFTFGAIGWLIVCVEAMVAAPIVALGILSPGGEHEIFGRAQPTPLILLNIFLRPTMMVFGLVAGLLMSYVVVYFINGAFYNVMVLITQNSGLGLLEAFFYIIAYAGLVVVAINKCFALIHLVPDKVLRWLGQHGEGFGEEQMLGEVKGKVSAGAEQAQRVGGAVGSEGAGAASRTSQAYGSKVQQTGAAESPGGSLGGKPSAPAGSAAESKPTPPGGEDRSGGAGGGLGGK